MKAMILAAGLGTRLQPLTDTTPKALVDLNGRPLLEITIERLRSFGVTEFIVNVHHHAEKIVSFLESKNNFGCRVEISREDDLLLDTGGGLKKAAWFFLEGNSDEPFFLHNVDVLSSIDLRHMLAAHTQSASLATLAVMQRKSSRQLLFNDQNLLVGRRKGKDIPDELIPPALSSPLATRHMALAFCGIHVLSPRILPLISESGVFSIIDTYLRLASAGQKISAFRADSFHWRDLGRLQDLQQAEQDIISGIAPLV
jgi:NDP-sugar pyrophosphorylase family protein